MQHLASLARLARAAGLAAAAAIAIAACTPAAPPAARPGARGPRADEHLDAAREHDRRAHELARWPETRPSGSGTFDDPRAGLWYRRVDTVQEEKQAAASHCSSAADIHARYQEACGDAPLSEVSVSPLQRHALGGTNVEDGVIVFLRPDAGTPEALLRAIRCHRAWMMLGERGMEDCPLDLEGIRVVAHGDPTGISVEITVADPALVPELQRRAAKDLEMTASHHH
jgi:hypothetical protein